MNWQQEASSIPDRLWDVVIVGAGPAGVAAAMECAKQEISYRLFDAGPRLSTIENFPKGKPIFITPPGPSDCALRLEDGTKETLLESLKNTQI